MLSGSKLTPLTAAACSIKLSADPYARSRWPAWICVAFGITVCVSQMPASKTPPRAWLTTVVVSTDTRNIAVIVESRLQAA